jgi:hypothetical protein
MSESANIYKHCDCWDEYNRVVPSMDKRPNIDFLFYELTKIADDIDISHDRLVELLSCSCGVDTCFLDRCPCRIKSKFEESIKSIIVYTAQKYKTLYGKNENGFLDVCMLHIKKYLKKLEGLYDFESCVLYDRLYGTNLPDIILNVYDSIPCESTY